MFPVDSAAHLVDWQGLYMGAQVTQGYFGLTP